jgi:hypothetical protein
MAGPLHVQCIFVSLNFCACMRAGVFRQAVGDVAASSSWMIGNHKIVAFSFNQLCSMMSVPHWAWGVLVVARLHVICCSGKSAQGNGPGSSDSI